MVRLFILIRKRSDLSLEQFKEHYESTHAPLVHKLLSPTVWPDALVRSYFDPTKELVHTWQGVQVPSDKLLPYDCLITYDFGDPSKVQQWFGAYGQNAKVLQEDEARFMDRESIVMYTAEDFRTTV